MNLLYTLVRNDLRLKKESRHYLEHSIWIKIYASLALLVIIGAYTWELLKAPFEFNMGIMFWYMPILLVIQLILGMSMVRREWRSGTVAWWLTLPYPRSLLLLSKAIASFVTFMRSFAVFWAFALFFVLEAIVLRPDVYKAGDLLTFFHLSILGCLWLITLCPAIIFIGITLGTLMQSSLKPLLPPLWAFIIVGGNLISIEVIRIGVHYTSNGQFPIEFFTPGRSSLLGILTLMVSGVIGFIFLRLSTYLLEHRVDM